ncbi:dihydrofolate reductase family protein [Arthrobacter sp. zg-Y820]|uniref:dihydrofolate reductase family protein n=1 Tax=unclassified Arthrobacter TaxID=235627 RepID=UPI001E3B6FAE|nr:MULTISPECIES: dihydrofolate reductase family protein [unclassified Arthrobacter]MCC9197074.1 dihydrofolate reductase family protein [Arthrobacter sp. zg-Y820]MDK1279939.1 dihydrofolate reductase family protein [Arthrobacter sp. zg.Y820]MDK1361626.1 dihydrofolate reductase family protein [Arthrobacter sp. zg-Y1219]WIB09238.1 dihydrofolate reductase family protein [Arthrobacter sp. zg-Y820]
MTLSLNIFLSLDGVMQGPGAADEDRSGGFERGGWLVPHMDVGVGRTVTGWFARGDSLLLGRSTYEMMQPYWEGVTDPEDAVAYALNHLPKYLVSSTLTNPTWNNTRVLQGNPLAAVAALRAHRGEIQVHGSHQLARTLHDAGLVDEYRLLVFPVVVGSGKRLFETGATPSGFHLLESETLNSGALHLRLRPIPFGSGDFEARTGA